MGVPAMNKTIPYKWDDFTMLGLIERNPFVLVVSPDSGIKSFAEFEAKIKAGEEMSYSTAGSGRFFTPVSPSWPMRWAPISKS